MASDRTAVLQLLFSVAEHIQELKRQLDELADELHETECEYFRASLDRLASHHARLVQALPFHRASEH